MTAETLKGRPLPAVPAADSGDIADMATTDADSATSRRPTISSMQNFTPRRPPRANYATCTHLTMTRLYTKDFRCSICLKVAPMGWLYRCSQDRELLLEEDIDQGVAEKMDKLCDLFEAPAIPPKRSPLARMNRLSFLDEITDEQLKTYSKDQLNLILKQRAEVLEKVSEPDSTNPFSNAAILPPPFPLITASPSAAALFQTSPTSVSKTKKPWLPLRGGECQFKCCPRCRPGLQERAYLSLGGIADGDIPVTAILGFGFHLNKKRPVALVKHVKNLGMRSVPFPRRDSASTSDSRSSPIPKRRSKITTMGLGIFTTAKATITSNSTDDCEHGMVELSTSPTLQRSCPSLRNIKNLILCRRQKDHHHTSPRASLEQEVASLIPLPLPDIEEIAFFIEDGSDSQLEVDLPSIVVSDAEFAEMAKATSVMNAVDGDAELEEIPLTPMEKKELSSAHFSSQPLEVQDGVALLEESIELHVPDVITQF